MTAEARVWAVVVSLLSIAISFYLGVVVGAHTMVGKRVVIERTIGPHENDGYGVDR